MIYRAVIKSSHAHFIFCVTHSKFKWIAQIQFKKRRKNTRKLGQKSFYEDRCVKISVHSCKQLKLYNQVPSLSLFRWRTFTLEKIKIGWVLCIKIQTIFSCWEEYCESMPSWLLSEVWNIIAPNLSIFSTEKILNHQKWP